ncbi:cytochrome P450 3A24-like isoform X2 [Lytechinus pictus]|uniref:cytochrome P450 3A24-like isoform X2 n=1 Tax=Lytechinus pictus TaxID=7653 RepID=UPI0030BA039A
MSFSIFGFTISLPLIGAIAALIAGQEIWNLTYFWRKGIKCPRPLPLFGNILSTTKGFYLYMYNCKEKYGKIFGFYLFRRPVVVISDPDILKDILVKSFSKFTNHDTFVLKNRPLDQSLLDLRDQRWKDVRTVITPTFSALKMKQMSPLINECCDVLVTYLQKKREEDNDISIFSVFESFTTDGIAECAFGLQVDAQNNPDNQFVKHAKAIMEASVKSPVAMLAGIFPPSAYLFNALDIGLIPAATRTFFRDVVVKAIDMRKQSPNSERKDFLQLMMNAHNDDDIGSKVNKDTNDLHNLIEEHSDNPLSSTQKTQLTMDEIFAQALLFFAGGYDTTSLTLGFLAYSLATNPDIQDQLIKEVDEMTPTRDSVDYNAVAKMSLLDMVVCETLRLYPPAVVGERCCGETHTVRGLTIEKGSQIFYSMYNIHRDPSLWPEPEKFDPSRFSKQNRANRHPMAWIPFGAGPRNCIGMRFALMEIKMATVRILQKFRFVPSANTVIPVKFGTGENLKPDGGMFLGIEERV